MGLQDFAMYCSKLIFHKYVNYFVLFFDVVVKFNSRYLIRRCAIYMHVQINWKQIPIKICPKDNTKYENTTKSQAVIQRPMNKKKRHDISRTDCNIECMIPDRVEPWINKATINHTSGNTLIS